MNIFSRIGAIIVSLALASYSTAIITEQIKREVTRKVLIFLTAGIILDCTATACMIIGSRNSPFTFHGFLGYSSLAGMLIDTFMIWRFSIKNIPETKVNKGLHYYSRFAFIWWVIAYITGGLLVALR